MRLRLDALRRAAACCLTFGMLVLGCTDSHPGGRNGQTHWLRECKGSAECGTLLCVCGVCSADVRQRRVVQGRGRRSRGMQSSGDREQERSVSG